MKLPAAYRWLETIQPPRMVVEGLKLLGTIETPGKGNNPAIIGWAKEVGLERVYTADSIPWCGLFMAVVAHRADKTIPAQPLWALNWAKFGVEAGQPCLGDVLTFTREGGGHVALYLGEDDRCYHVLGGNQSDAVTITRIEKKRLYRARRPVWQIAQPASVRPYVLQPTGAVSINEA